MPSNAALLFTKSWHLVIWECSESKGMLQNFKFHFNFGANCALPYFVYVVVHPKVTSPKLYKISCVKSKGFAEFWFPVEVRKMGMPVLLNWVGRMVGGEYLLVYFYFCVWQTSKLFQKLSDFQNFSDQVFGKFQAFKNFKYFRFSESLRFVNW